MIMHIVILKLYTITIVLYYIIITVCSYPSTEYRVKMKNVFNENIQLFFIKKTHSQEFKFSTNNIC